MDGVLTFVHLEKWWASTSFCIMYALCGFSKSIPRITKSIDDISCISFTVRYSTVQ